MSNEPTQFTAYRDAMIRQQSLRPPCREDADPGVACVESSCSCQDAARAELVLMPDLDSAEWAWHRGAIARRSRQKQCSNPYPIRGSREWNSWVGAWQAVDRDIRTIDNG